MNTQTPETPAVESLTVNVPVAVTYKQIADLFTTGIEGGDARQWLISLHPGPNDCAVVTQGPWYSDSKFWAQESYTLTAVEDVNDDGDPKTGKVHKIGPAEVVAGIELMAREYFGHFADWRDDNDDAATGDVFLQCVILKDVVYG